LVTVTVIVSKITAVNHSRNMVAHN